MKKILILLVTVLLFVACDSSSDPAPNGFVKILITDAPFPAEFVKKAEVEILRIDVKRKGVSDTTKFLTISDVAKTMDLVQLRNGITETFGTAELETGTYDEIRMIAGDATVELTDGSIFDLKLPSGSSSGIKVKIDPELAINSDITTEVLIDFDIAKSFIVKGPYSKVEDIKGFNFKPVIRAVNETETGGVAGTVKDDSSNVVKDASIWLSQGGDIITTTFSEASGKYALIGIPEGIYDLFATAAGHDTVSVLNFQIVAGENKTQDFTLTKK